MDLEFSALVLVYYSRDLTCGHAESTSWYVPKKLQYVSGRIVFCAVFVLIGSCPNIKYAAWFWFGIRWRRKKKWFDFYD